MKWLEERGEGTRRMRSGRRGEDGIDVTCEGMKAVRGGEWARWVTWVGL